MSNFIAIEGVDEAGKSTLTRNLADLLIARGHDVITTRVPGGTPYAEELRAILLSEKGAAMTSQEQLQLAHQAQLDHVRNKISPAAHSGQIVISDRYELSSYVYQVAKQPDLADQFFQMKEELDDLLGEHTAVYLLLDLSPEEILNRVQKSDKLHHFDVLTLEDIQRRRQVYLESIPLLGNPYHILDATIGPIELALQAAEQLGL